MIKAIVLEANEAATILIGLQFRVTLGKIDHPLLGGPAGALGQEVHVVLFPFLLGGRDLLLRVRAVVHFDHWRRFVVPEHSLELRDGLCG